MQKWIEDGRVTVNGRPFLRVAARVAYGDLVVVELPDERERTPVLAEEGALDILFEDAHFLIVNKPAGVVSHPTYGHATGSLLNTLLWHARSWPSGERPSLVGRLDKHTSGVIVVARTTDAHAHLQRTLMSSFSEKRYLAVVYGPMNDERGQIDLKLQRHPDDRRLVVASPDEGLTSLTRFHRLSTADVADCPVALAACQIVTGRMHQVRVHMAARGWPLVGDAKYGEPRHEQCTDPTLREMLGAFPRQALHAWRTAFAHPFTNERVEVTAPVPDDMRALIDACGLGAGL